MSLEELCELSFPRLQAGCINKTIDCSINKEDAQNSAHFCDLISQYEICFDSWCCVTFTGCCTF